MRPWDGYHATTVPTIPPTGATCNRFIFDIQLTQFNETNDAIHSVKVKLPVTSPLALYTQ